MLSATVLSTTLFVASIRMQGPGSGSNAISLEYDDLHPEEYDDLHPEDEYDDLYLQPEDGTDLHLQPEDGTEQLPNKMVCRKLRVKTTE